MSNIVDVLDMAKRVSGLEEAAKEEQERESDIEFAKNWQDGLAREALAELASDWQENAAKAAERILPGKGHFMPEELSSKKSAASALERSHARKGACLPEDLSAKELEMLCDPRHMLFFQGNGTILYSNLQGHGPTQGSPFGVAVQDVFPFASHLGEPKTDLKITALGKYIPHDQNKNWVKGQLLNINLHTGSEVELLFQFSDSEANSRFTTTKPFAFSVLDLDRQPNGEAVEGISLQGYDKYVLPRQSTVDVVEGEDGNISFTSTAAGVGDDFPMYAMSLDQARKRNVVTFIMPALNNFTLKLSASEGWNGRNFGLSGVTNTICAQRMSCAEWTCPDSHELQANADAEICKGTECTVADDLETCCQPELDESRQLAAAGALFPEQSLTTATLGHEDNGEMIFGDVFPNSTEIVDLKVTASEEFESQNPDANTQSETSLEINLKCGQAAQLDFNFLDRATGAPRQAGSFTFTVHGLNAAKHNEGVQSIVVLNAISYHASHPSAIAVNHTESAEGKYTSVGVIANSVSQNDHIVQFVLEPTSNFSVLVAVSQGCAGGRKFTFSGEMTATPGHASCNTITCPDDHRKVEGAAGLSCAASECGPVDYDICCEPWEPDECNPEHAMIFQPGSLVHSNLGGLGPHFSSPKTILLGDVFPLFPNKTIDLEITTDSKYVAQQADDNVIVGSFLNLNVKCGESVDLTVRFFDRADPNNSVKLPTFIMSVFDFDSSYDSAGTEQVAITEPEDIIVSSNTSVMVDHINDKYGNQVRFTATLEGDCTDNPSTPSEMTQLDEEKAVSLLWRDMSSFQATLGVTPCGGQGRNFLMAGWSDLVCPSKQPCSELRCPVGFTFRPDYATRRCASSTCAADDVPRCCYKVFVNECKPENVLTLDETTLMHSNLGGAGPDEGLQVVRYHNVFPDEETEQTIDVEVSNLTAYHHRTNFGLNGVRWGYGKVFVRTGTAVTLEFKFFDHHTNKEVEPPSFLFSFFDLDAYVNDLGDVTVSVEGAQEFRVSPLTKLRIFGDLFTGGTMHEVGATVFDNNEGRHPLSLNASELNNTVAFHMANVSSFKVHIQVASMGDSEAEVFKRVWFGGASNLVCPEVATCAQYACPSDMVLRKKKAHLTCIGSTCTQEDIPYCCIRKPVHACSPKHMLHLRNSQVVEESYEDKDWAMIIYDVMPLSGKHVWMRVAHKGTYYTDDPGWNTVKGDFGRLGVNKGSTAEFKFELWQTEHTGAGAVDRPYDGGAFYFSINNFFEELDDDGQPDGHMKVEVDGHEQVYMTDSSLVERDGNVFETHAIGEDHMKSNMSLPNMTAAMLDRSVTFLIKEGAEWTVTISVDAGSWESHNTRFVNFAGATPDRCPTRETCATYDCPHGYRHRNDSEHLFCEEAMCDTADLDTCCLAHSR